jgi:hypothetical protein
MLSGHVTFPVKNGPVLARATEILAHLVKGLAFVEPANPAQGDSSL